MDEQHDSWAGGARGDRRFPEAKMPSKGPARPPGIVNSHTARWTAQPRENERSSSLPACAALWSCVGRACIARFSRPQGARSASVLVLGANSFKSLCCCQSLIRHCRRRSLSPRVLRMRLQRTGETNLQVVLLSLPQAHRPRLIEPPNLPIASPPSWPLLYPQASWSSSSSCSSSSSSASSPSSASLFHACERCLCEFLSL